MVEAKNTPKTRAPRAKKAPKTAPLKVVESTAVPMKRAPQSKSGEFAIFATGGKQYRVSVGDLLKIEKIIGEHKEGDKITFDKVLLVDDGASETSIGTPFIKGASISATLKKIGRYPTIEVIKYKQKSRYFKRNGHRQPYFEVHIDSIK